MSGSWRPLPCSGRSYLAGDEARAAGIIITKGSTQPITDPLYEYVFDISLQAGFHARQWWLHHHLRPPRCVQRLDHQPTRDSGRPWHQVGFLSPACRSDPGRAPPPIAPASGT